MDSVFLHFNSHTANATKRTNRTAPTTINTMPQSSTASSSPAAAPLSSHQPRVIVTLPVDDAVAVCELLCDAVAVGSVSVPVAVSLAVADDVNVALPVAVVELLSETVGVPVAVRRVAEIVGDGVTSVRDGEWVGVGSVSLDVGVAVSFVKDIVALCVRVAVADCVAVAVALALPDAERVGVAAVSVRDTLGDSVAVDVSVAVAEAVRV